MGGMLNAGSGCDVSKPAGIRFPKATNCVVYGKVVLADGVVRISRLCAYFYRSRIFSSEHVVVSTNA